MKKYGLHGSLKATSGKRDELAQILLYAAKMVSTANGCLLYFVSIDNTDADSIWITEAWDSKEDHDNSLKAENVRTLISRAMPLLDGIPVKGLELDILGGKGINH